MSTATPTEDHPKGRLVDPVEMLKDDGTNLSTWKFIQLQVFTARNLVGYIDGSIPKPTDPAEIPNWTKYNNAASLQITMHVGPDTLHHIMDKIAAKDMWNAVLAKFGGDGPQAAHFIHQKICRTVLVDDKSMSVQINEFKNDVRQFRGLGYEISDTLLAFTLLSALPNSYATTCTLLLQKGRESLTVDEIVASVLTEEERRKGQNALALQARADPKSKQKKKGKGGTNGEKPKCTNPKCGKIGHTIQNCWAEGGGAEGKGPNNKSSSAKTNDAKSSDAKAKIAKIEEIEEVSILYSRIEGPVPDDIGDRIFVASKVARKLTTDSWILDSGASRHVTNDRSIMTSYTHLDTPVRIWMADGSYILAEGIGRVYMRTQVNDRQSRCLFRDVLYAPEMAGSLISIPQLAKNGFRVDFVGNRAKILDAKDQTIVEAEIEDGLYKLQGNATNDEHARIGRVAHEDIDGEATLVARMQKSAATLNLWHRRLAHLNDDDVMRLCRKGMVDGMEIIPQSTTQNSLCGPCLQGKQTREPIPKESDTRATEPLHRIHTDLCDIGQVSREGYRYYVTFIDDYSRFTEVTPLKSKDETLDAFKKFVARTENELGKRVVRLRSDGGGEYFSNDFAAFCAEKGIVQEKTNPDTPQQNGVAERRNQTLNNKARSMLAGASLTARFWVSAIQHANWIANRSPTRAIPEDKTPFEAFYNQKPSLLSLREYGCRAWVQVPKKHRAKFDHQSIECQYLGFAQGKKAFLLYDPANRRVIESRDVKFHEDANKDRIILSDGDDDDWLEEEDLSGDKGEAGETGSALSASGGDEDTENRSPHEEDASEDAPEPELPPITPPEPRRSGRV